MDNSKYGMIVVSVLTITFMQIPIKHVNCQGLTVCNYLDGDALIRYVNGDVETREAFFHWTQSDTETYFTLTTSVSAYQDDTEITVTFNVFNLGDGTIETLVIQARTIYGDTVGEWTPELSGFATSCDFSTTENTIYHFGSVPHDTASSQFIARDIGGLTITFQATVKVKVLKDGVPKEYFYYGVQSDPVLPIHPSPCNSVPCHNQGKCLPSLSGTTHICMCTQEWTGPTCRDRSPCNPSPCANNGTCHELLPELSYWCECSSDWSGIQCNVPSSPCASSPCMNGGICFVDASFFTCHCTSGWMGDRCQLPSSPCASSPCMNGGLCHEDAVSFTCTCTAGWSGDRCQSKTPCSPNPCLSGGYCNIVNENEFRCTCSQGYDGNICQFFNTHTVSRTTTRTSSAPTTHAPCTADTCKNDGECQETPEHTSGIPGYLCHCQDGFHGLRCEFSEHICDSTPCLHDGECFASSDSILLCKCQPPWKGTFCDQKENDNALIIGATVGCLSFLIIVVTILLIIRYFHKRRNRLPQHRPSAGEPIYLDTQHVPGTLRPGVFTNNNDIANVTPQNDGLSFDNAGYQSTVIYGQDMNAVTLEQPTTERFYESHI